MSQPQNNLNLVGGLPRPRVLVLGDWKAENMESFTRLFLTCWSMWTLPNDLDPNDIDLVIAGPNSYSDSSHVYLRRCPLIMLGMAPDLDHNINFCATRPSRRIEAVLPSVPPELHKLRQRELFEIHDYSQWTTLYGWASNDHGSQLPLNECSLLHNTENRPLGFVTNPLRSPFSKNRYRACLPWQVKYPVEWVITILSYWAEAVPKDHPYHRSWNQEDAWMTPSERKYQDELNELDKEEQRQLARINAARAAAFEKLTQSRTDADRGIRRLLTTQNDALVEITTKILQEIGFDVHNMDIKTPIGQRVEDLQIKHHSIGDEIILCEVKGFKGSGGKLSDLSKLRTHVSRFNREYQRAPYRSWFIVNGQFEQPPTRRDQPFRSDKEAVRSLEEEEILVISTCDLYRLVNDERLTPDARRDALLEKIGGVFRYPPDN